LEIKRRKRDFKRNGRDEIEKFHPFFFIVRKLFLKGSITGEKAIF